MAETMVKTKNISNAADLLGSSVKTVFFHGGKVSEPEVAIYYRDNSARQIFYRTVDLNEEVASWKMDDWVRFIEDGARDYLENSKLVPDEVVSVVVTFKLSKLPKNPKSLYTVECTDISHIRGYDHFMVTGAASRKHYEMWFTPEQIAEIKSVFDAVDFVGKIGPDKLRLRPEQSDLPWICLHGNKR